MSSFRPLFVFGTMVIFIGMLMNIVGLGTTHWQETNVSLGSHTGSIDAGLFRICGLDCETIDNPSSKLAATQGTIIVGMLASLVECGAAILCFKRFYDRKEIHNELLTTIEWSSFGAFVMIITAVVIYDVAVHDEGILGYSFALCVVGAIFLGAGAVVTIIGARKVDADDD